MRTSTLLKPTLVVLGIVLLFGCLGCDPLIMPDLEQFTLTYDDNGSDSGSLPADPTKYEVDAQVTVLGNTGNLAKSGYEFAGWNTKADGSGSGYVAGDTFEMPAQDVTLFAVWQAVAARPVTYGVAYTAPNATGGTAPADSNAYEQGETVTVLGRSDLARTGYTFGGWSDGSTTYAAGDTFSMPATDVQLAAVWSTETYSITYNLDGGSNDPANPTSYTIESATITLQDASKSGYTFGGWYSDAGLTAGNEVTQIVAGSTGDVTLYAKFTPIPTYNVSYSAPDADGGTIPTDSTAYAESDTVAVQFPGDLAQAGYTFAGWSDGATTYTSGGTTSFAMPAQDVTLTAVWNEDIVSVSGTVQYFSADLTLSVYAYEAGAWATISDKSAEIAGGFANSIESATTVDKTLDTSQDSPRYSYAYSGLDLLNVSYDLIAGYSYTDAGGAERTGAIVLAENTLIDSGTVDYQNQLVVTGAEIGYPEDEAQSMALYIYDPAEGIALANEQNSGINYVNALYSVNAAFNSVSGNFEYTMYVVEPDSYHFIVGVVSNFGFPNSQPIENISVTGATSLPDVDLYN